VTGLLIAAAQWADQPVIDWHAIAPEVVLVATAALLIVLDVTLLERAKPLISAVAGLGLLASIIPVITLAISDDTTRSLFGGAYVIDRPSLLLKALFILTGYVVVLMSTNYIAEGDYWESEYYTLLVLSIVGMTVMSSARDLISVFIAFELLSIPTYMMSAWRKGDVRSNEAGLKYYLMGIFATGVLLYGMSLLYGVGGTTSLAGIGERIAEANSEVITLAVIFTVVGFGFKVSAVPFHMWAPDTYEGAPTPVTAFLSVASKAGGFVALINVVYFCFVAGGASGRSNVLTPAIFIISALSMTVGNVIALRQSNVVRLLAYSGIAQAGFILAPFAVAGERPGESYSSVIVYLVIYAAMNLGAFAVVIAAARKTRSAEISSMRGMFQYAPGLTLAMTIFLFSLMGIPPLGGWYAKFGIWKVLVDANTGYGYALAILLAINTVVAAGYYLRIAKAMWFEDAADGDTAPVVLPSSLRYAMAICVIATLLFGVLPNLLSQAASVVAAGV